MCFFNGFWRVTQLLCAQTQCLARAWNLPGWFIIIVLLLQTLRRPGEAGFTDSFVGHLHNWDAHFEWAIVCPISRINLVWTSEKILSLRVCGFVRLRHSQPNLYFWWMSLRTSAIEVRSGCAFILTVLVTSENYIFQCVDKWSDLFCQYFSWARLGLDKAQFSANPFFPMFLLGWPWAGAKPFFQWFSWARFGLDQAQFWPSHFANCVWLLGLGPWQYAHVSSYAPRLNSDLDVLAAWPNVNVGIVEVGILLSSWREKRMICNSCFGS